MKIKTQNKYSLYIIRIYNPHLRKIDFFLNYLNNFSILFNKF